MRYHKLFTFIITLLCALSAKAAVLIVTSNADSGPGTLREALTLAAANGSATQDFVVFALTDLSEAGRTITLQTVLPDVSSNLIIDGSTQLGGKLAVGEGKVVIALTKFAYLNINKTVVAAFTIYQQKNVEVYGFKITGFNRAYYNSFAGGIFIADSQNIQIGSPGKGNWISDCELSIWGLGIFGEYTNTNNSDITIQSNFIDFDSPNLGWNPKGMNITSKNLTIGGNIAAEGNHIKFSSQFYGNNLKISHNFFDINEDGTEDPDYLSLVECSGSTNVEVSYNTSRKMRMTLRGINNFKVFANTDVAVNLHTALSSVSMDRCVDGVIGSEDENLKNVFYTNTGIPYDYITTTFQNTSSKNIQILKNEIVCALIAYSIYIEPQDNIVIPDIKVLVNNNSEYSGTSSPNSDIYIYYDDSDCPVCSPRKFFSKIKADNAGNWKISGNFSGKRLVSNALLQNNSSEYTQPFFATQNHSVKNPSCGLSNGSIKIPGGYKHIIKIEWFNASTNEKIGEGDFIEKLGPGNYYAIGYNGECYARTDDIVLFNNEPVIDATNLKKTDVSCGAGGSITGLSAYTYSQVPPTYEWKNKAGSKVGDQLNINGLAAGEYSFTITDNESGCAKTHGPVVISNSTGLVINDASPTITPTKCYERTGSITGITATGAGTLKYSWRNESNLEVGTNANLTGQPPGKYMLMVSDESNCGPVFSSQQEIPGTNDITINEGSKTIIYATCDNFNGFITGIQVTGTGLTYSWRNQQNVEVGTALDLVSAAAGTYKLIVSSGLYCEPVTSTPITIKSINGVSLDYTGQGGRSATCNENNGSITGLKTTGATTYQWMVTGTTDIVSDKLDLLNMPAGFYTLTISNATCSKSYDFEVAGFPPTVFTGITYTKTKTCDGAGNGTITLNTTNANEEPTQYLWLDEQGNPVGYTKEVQFLKAGKYRLQLTNKNFCPVLYPEVFTIEAYPKLEIKSYGTVTNATCGVGTGSITATQFIGGSSNYTYQWYDENNNAIPGKTDAFLNNLVPGKYRLHLEDGTCNPGDVTYTIADEAVTPPPPSADNIQVYNTGAAVIKINNPFPTAIYRLYETATSPQPIKDTIGGNITVNVTESRSYYVSLTYGYCESTRTQVKVFLSALNGNIPNTFTPNNDGINDYWNIPGLDTYPNATVNIFNRYGQAVFQSVGYANPFDGNRNGKPLPTGVYYYIINLKRGDVLSGNVTILR